MSDTTSPGRDEWSSHTEPQSPGQAHRPSKRRRTASHGAASQEVGLMRSSGTTGSPRFIGSGSGIHFIRTVYDVLARTTAAGGHQADRSHIRGDLVPGEDDQLVDPSPDLADTPGTRSRAPFWRPEETIDDVAPGAPPVNFDNLIRWTKGYFDSWHPAFPFLHGPEVLETFERVAAVGISGVSEPDATIVRAMVSISLADARQGGALPEAIPVSLLFLSQEHTSASLVFTLGCPASLKNIQAATCVQLFLISMLKFNMASRLGGIIVRMSNHLGLYRCPFRYPNFSRHESLMRKRIWWSVYCLERMVCQALGHPLDIVDDDGDVCLPSQELHRNVPSKQGTEDTEADPLLLLTLLAKHARLRGLILELRHKSIAIRHDTVERAMIVQTELAKWANDVHELTEDQDPESPCAILSITQSQKTLLSIMHHESTITLNRPLLASDRKTPASKAALQACISASRAIIDIIITGASQGSQRSGESFHNVMVWPLLTWSVWMSAFILTYAALLGEATVASSQRYAKKALYILKELSSRGTIWPDSCARGVEHLVLALNKNQREGSPHAGRPLESTIVNQRQSGLVARSSTEGQRNRPAEVDNRDSLHSLSETPSRLVPSTPDQSNNRPAAFPTGHTQSLLNDVQYRTPTIAAHYHQGPGPGQVAVSESSFEENINQDWFDPLVALDFSNFAQGGFADTLGFGF